VKNLEINQQSTSRQSGKGKKKQLPSFLTILEATSKPKTETMTCGQPCNSAGCNAADQNKNIQQQPSS